MWYFSGVAVVGVGDVNFCRLFAFSSILCQSTDKQDSTIRGILVLMIYAYSFLCLFYMHIWMVGNG